MPIRSLLIAIALGVLGGGARAAVLHVPGDHPSIQAAVDAAEDGDAVLVAPGLYRENVVLGGGRRILLVSRAAAAGRIGAAGTRVIDGPEAAVIDGAGATAITVAADIGPGSAVQGFTLRGGGRRGDGVLARGRFSLLDSVVEGNRDGIDYEGGGGLIRNCMFRHNLDDGIDLDGDVALHVRESVIVDNGNDGIEIRLHPVDRSPPRIAIRGNRIARNREDGIQLIGEGRSAARTVWIERNWIEANGAAGLGLMCCGRSREDFSGAPLPGRVRIRVVGNTFVANRVGISGGADLLAVNNLFLAQRDLAVSRVLGRSLVAHSLFWRNGANHSASNLAVGTNGFGAGPTRDAGVDRLRRGGRVVLRLPPGSWRGAAPDIGAIEAP